MFMHTYVYKDYLLLRFSELSWDNFFIFTFMSITVLSEDLLL